MSYTGKRFKQQLKNSKYKDKWYKIELVKRLRVKLNNVRLDEDDRKYLIHLVRMDSQK
jgi:hypothetical protein